MASDYVVEYKLNGRHLGAISKYPKGHIFNSNGRRTYQCWVGGCGVGPNYDDKRHKTLAGAKEYLAEYLMRDWERRRDDLLLALSRSTSNIQLLESEGLSAFEEKRR